LLKLMGLGGVAFASGLAPGLFSCGGSAAPRGAQSDFFFLQLSDTHWGFAGSMQNPQFATMLKDTVSVINSVATKPDFVIFTGDLIHDDMATDQPTRLSRMTEFMGIVGGITGTMLKFIPGEHDAAADQGMTFQQVFGPTHWSFDHKGIHFVALDNVSSPTASLGSDQLAWLQSDLKPLDKEAPIVVFAHRPLFPLYPQWDWTTADGQMAIDILSAHDNVTVFYGHIHQNVDTMTGAIAHHSARSLMFAFPTAGSAPMRTPIPWDPQNPGTGLGYRSVDAGVMAESYKFTDFPPGLMGG
jgi:3',5'-cyclic AMP phosphodiesterase CpdA